jgi:predicted metal-dependent hydrolase
MKTRWGTCNYIKKVITLNTRLFNFNKNIIEYVIMHEYVHFLHANHGKYFHEEMQKRMPDYKERRKILKG